MDIPNRSGRFSLKVLLENRFLLFVAVLTTAVACSLIFPWIFWVSRDLDWTLYPYLFFFYLPMSVFILFRVGRPPVTLTREVLWTLGAGYVSSVVAVHLYGVFDYGIAGWLARGSNLYRVAPLWVTGLMMLVILPWGLYIFWVHSAFVVLLRLGFELR